MSKKSAALLALVAVMLGSASTAGAQTFRSSTTKYRERYPVFFGTSGTVKLSARMLAAADGTTELVATTGDIDSPTPGSGNLIGLLMTASDSRGRLVFNKLFSNSNGTGTLTKAFTGLVPGQAFFLQGIVLKTVSGRTGLYYVNVNARVQRRPDLYVHDVVAPARVPVNTPFQVTAVISEINGHVGARSNCVMYVDDVEVDRAPGIWVDSADSVSCAFTHTVQTVSFATIKVRAESVNPGDWDYANNEASTLVHVFSPTYDAIAAVGTIYDMNRVGTKDYGRYVNSSLTTGADFIYETLKTGVGDAFEYAALKLIAPGAPTRVTISASDGKVAWAVQRDLTACTTLDVGNEGGRLFWYYVVGCNGSLWTQAGSNAGSVTYTSIEWMRTFKVVKGVIVPDQPTQYVENRTEVVAPTTLTGPTWTLNVGVDIDGVTFGGPVTFDIVTPFDNGAVTTVCLNQPLLVHCTDTGWRQVGRSGQFLKELLAPPAPPGIQD